MRSAPAKETRTNFACVATGTPDRPWTPHYPRDCKNVQGWGRGGCASAASFSYASGHEGQAASGQPSTHPTRDRQRVPTVGDLRAWVSRRGNVFCAGRRLIGDAEDHLADLTRIVVAAEIQGVAMHGR